MNIRRTALGALLALSLVSVASAEETKTPPQNYGPAMMMGQGWSPAGGGWGGMMGYGGGRGYGSGMMMGGAWGGGMMGGCGGGYGMGYGRGARGADIETYVDGRIAFLKAELKITDAQGTAWDAYADALRANSQVMAGMHKQMFDAFQKDDRSPVTFIDLHIQAMRSRLAALEALKPATEALYKALSKEQREKADDILPVMGCM